jgi:hypothetical protein
MVTDASVPVERVGRAALRRSFRRRSRKALRRFLRFTGAPDFEIRIGTAACASVGARYRFTRPGRGREATRGTRDRGQDMDTGQGAKSPNRHAQLRLTL